MLHCFTLLLAHRATRVYLHFLLTQVVSGWQDIRACSPHKISHQWRVFRDHIDFHKRSLLVLKQQRLSRKNSMSPYCNLWHMLLNLGNMNCLLNLWILNYQFHKIKEIIWLYLHPDLILLKLDCNPCAILAFGFKTTEVVSNEFNEPLFQLVAHVIESWKYQLFVGPMNIKLSTP